MAYYNWNQNSPEIPQSKYNSAFFKIQRLSESWTACRRYFRVGDYVSLNEELKLIWMELFADATAKQRAKNEKLIKRYKTLLKTNGDVRRKRFEMFELLQEKWIFLTEVEKEQGLGKSYIDPEEDEW